MSLAWDLRFVGMRSVLRVRVTSCAHCTREAFHTLHHASTSQPQHLLRGRDACWRPGFRRGTIIYPQQGISAAVRPLFLHSVPITTAHS
jgi:hypothetical protein